MLSLSYFQIKKYFIPLCALPCSYYIFCTSSDSWVPCLLAWHFTNWSKRGSNLFHVCHCSPVSLHPITIGNISCQNDCALIIGLSSSHRLGLCVANFLLFPHIFPLMRETDKKGEQFCKIQLINTPILPNCQVPYGGFFV